MWFKASAPGSLMLLGEYAVLNGGQAVVAAIDQRMNVTLRPRTDSIVTITSALGKYEGTIESINPEAPFQFILTALKQYKLSSGCDLLIEAEFSDKMGFASSAAVTVATVSVLQMWLNQPISPDELILKSRAVIREVQGIGSGADVAACVLGGVVAYQAEPFIAETMAFDHPITVMYSGSKTKTADAIQYVKNQFAEQPHALNELMQKINVCAQAGVSAIKANDVVELGKTMNAQQQLMEQLGVCTPSLQNLITLLSDDVNIKGVKISGSGLGDCVVGLGDAVLSQKINVSLTSRGAYCEKG